MKFRYRKVNVDPSPAFPNRKHCWRPIIPISLNFDGQSRRYEALIDSGSDYNLFPSELGRDLGIDIESGKRNPIVGVNGQQLPLYFHQVEITVGGKTSIVDIGFGDGIHNLQGILGQHGFFNLFRVKFSLDKEQIELT